MRMHPSRTLFVGFSFVLAGCGGGAGGAPSKAEPPAAAPTLQAGEVAKHPDKYKGQKVTLTGIYTQGYGVGAPPNETWALVIKDAPADTDSVSCLIPAKVQIQGKDAKLTAHGTVEVEASGAQRINLRDCTYEVAP